MKTIKSILFLLSLIRNFIIAVMASLERKLAVAMQCILKSHRLTALNGHALWARIMFLFCLSLISVHSADQPLDDYIFTARVDPVNKMIYIDLTKKSNVDETSDESKS